MKKKMLIAVIFFIILILSIFVYNIISHHKEISKYKFVEEYINQNYGIECEITKYSYTYNEYGISGGLYMYGFQCKDKSGKKYIITYSEYKDLTKDTVSNLKFENNIK